MRIWLVTLWIGLFCRLKGVKDEVRVDAERSGI